MNVRQLASVIVFATAAAWTDASRAGSLSGSLDGYVSGSVLINYYENEENGGSGPIFHDIDIEETPATLTFSIYPVSNGVESHYECEFSIEGAVLPGMGGSFSLSGYGGIATAYINEGNSGGPGASAGGQVYDYSNHIIDGSGYFTILDPIGAYIASGGTASPEGVTASASISMGFGWSSESDSYSLGFSTRSVKPSTPPLSAVPEPSSILLLTIGCPGLLAWRRRRRAGRIDRTPPS